MCVCVCLCSEFKENRGGICAFAMPGAVREALEVEGQESAVSARSVGAIKSCPMNSCFS